MLEFQGVDTHYGDLHVLKAVDYRIEAGEIVCLLGGNASGKSTTMKAIMGVVRPTRGDILYDGTSLAAVSTNSEDQALAECAGVRGNFEAAIASPRYS